MSKCGDFSRQNVLVGWARSFLNIKSNQISIHLMTTTTCKLDNLQNVWAKFYGAKWKQPCKINAYQKKEQEK